MPISREFFSLQARTLKFARLWQASSAACARMLMFACLVLVSGTSLAQASQQSSQQSSQQAPADVEVLVRDFFPRATRTGPMEGEPPSAAVFRKKRLLGYIFFSQDVVASKGFSSKPFNIAIGLSADGLIKGARIIEQHEPILVIGVKEADLDRFVGHYIGLDVRHPVKVVRSQRKEGQIDAVSGATVSSIVMSDAIFRSARTIGRMRHILDSAPIDFDSFQPRGWDALLAEGSLVTARILYGQVDEALRAQNAGLFAPGAREPEPQALIAELFIGLATPARVGRNLLGDLEFNSVMANLPQGDQVIFVAANGFYSFKGTAYRRSGVFDRFQIVQGDKTHVITREQYHPVKELEFQKGQQTGAGTGNEIGEAPELRDLALFVMPAQTGFDPAKPWRFELAVKGETSSGEEASALFTVPYTLPDRYRLKEVVQERTLFGYSVEGQIWFDIWTDRGVDIIIVVFALLCLSVILVMQDQIARSKKWHGRIRIGFLIFTTVWLGWYAGAQLSVINVLTFSEALRTGFEWDFFLLEPLVFILWGFVALALLFWGRGVYCGWLCPFGAMQELISKLAKALHIPQLKIPFAVHERLWPIKYVIFVVLFAVALGDMALAQTLAEIEPFKTAVIFHFVRDWRFVLYALLLLSAGLFVERAWCRYLCPLGAALAIPARLRMFEWLRRYWVCGTQCSICAGTCPVQAIHPEGQINPSECVHCLNCQVVYYDDQVCPTMVQKRKRREKLAASPAPDLASMLNDLPDKKGV